MKGTECEEHCFYLEKETWDSMIYKEVYTRETNYAVVLRVPVIQSLSY